MLQSRGFTLIEVIVALGILSLIMLATVSGYRTLGNTATSIDRMTDRTDELRSVSAFLRDALENAVVGTESGGGDEMTFGGSAAVAAPVSYFKVSKGSLEWRAKVLFGEAYGGSYFLRLAKRNDELVLQWQEPDGQFEPNVWSKSPSRKVLDKLEAFEIWTRMDANAKWTRSDVEGEAPSHVKLVIKARGRFWPDLIRVVQR